MDSQQQETAKTFDSYESSYSNAVSDAIAFTGLTVDFFTRVKAGYILELAEAHFADPSRIAALDVGCGVGNYHKIVRPAVGSLSGVDVSAASVERARANKLDVAYEVYDGMRLPYADNSFDLVFTICVIHHVPTGAWDNFASEMHRVVKPGGLALVFEHNPLNPLTMRAVNNCPFDADAVLLRSGRTVELLTKAGFRDVDARFILSIPAVTRSLRRIDRLVSKVPFGAQYYVAAVR